MIPGWKLITEILGFLDKSWMDEFSDDKELVEHIQRLQVEESLLVDFRNSVALYLKLLSNFYQRLQNLHGELEDDVDKPNAMEILSDPPNSNSIETTINVSKNKLKLLEFLLDMLKGEWVVKMEATRLLSQIDSIIVKIFLGIKAVCHKLKNCKKIRDHLSKIHKAINDLNINPMVTSYASMSNTKLMKKFDKLQKNQDKLTYEYSQLNLLLKRELPILFELIGFLKDTLQLSFIFLQLLLVYRLAGRPKKWNNQLPSYELIDLYRQLVKDPIKFIEKSITRFKEPEYKTITKQCQVLYSYTAQNKGDLTIQKGQIINIISKHDGWYFGELDGIRGLFPGNYVNFL